MSIPISIEKLLEENIVEWARIEFKEGWNPDTTLKTISAFANDIDNWGGGYVVIGIEEENGHIKEPIKGLNINEIDNIQKELLKYCKYLKPSYLPITQPVQYKNAHLLLVWCPGGYERPYQCPKIPTSKSKEKTYYIRKLSSTIEASDYDIKELISLSNNIPFDDRMNMKAEISDLKHPLIRNYLQEVGSSLYESANTKSVEELSSSMRIIDGPKEFQKPVNVGLMFFSDDIEKFFPYSRIELVNIPDPTGQGMEEKTFIGPIDQQLKNALSYIKNNIITEKVFKISGQAEAIRVKNYSYDAIEEFLCNAIYHRSYQSYEPITVRIEKNLIEITSTPGPDRSISDEDIKNFTMRTRRYRNRRIGDFLKELHLVEGRNTGIPTALKAIKENGSPLPKLITDEDRSFFSVILPIHESFIDKSTEIKTKKRRRAKDEIVELIIKELNKSELSQNELYSNLGYSGKPSPSFIKTINELINNGIIDGKNSQTSKLKLRKQ